MKKIVTCFALTMLLFACKKTELPVQTEKENETVGAQKKGSGGGGGGGMTVTTDEASYILPFGATAGGSVSSGGGGNSVSESGVCFSTSSNPTIDDKTVPSGSGSGTFTSILSGLLDNTTYYVRAYANKSKKDIIITTTYGNEVSFTTSDPNYGTVTDYDGNEYTTIEIGTQTWMMENLKTTKYRDGTPIDNVTDAAEWAGLSSGAYCNYNNDVSNVATYGRLYNWYAVDDAHNIAPAGWHVPTEDELRILSGYVGHAFVGGARLKEAGFVHWNEPYVAGNEGNNGSGFSALPGGARRGYGGPFTFGWKHQSGYWWTADEYGVTGGENMYLQFSSLYIWGIEIGQGSDDHDKRSGFSVRCIKD